MAETPQQPGGNGRNGEHPPVGSPPNPHDTQPRVPQRQDVGRQMLGERERTYRLLALVKGDIFSKPKHRMMADEVMVWPDLVVLEMLCAVVFTILLIAVSVLINSPLEGLADPTCTPNPSKAPWYFMNLQELLLHMHPALAGVLVPLGALALIAAIPYYDRDPRGVGVYFTTPTGMAISVFSYIYATVLTFLLVLFDKYTHPDWRIAPGAVAGAGAGGMRYVFAWLIEPLDAMSGDLQVGQFVLQIVIPLIPMFGLSALLCYIVKLRWGGNPRYYSLALFSGFVAAYVILTFVGTAMRGQGMDLFLPWAVPPRHGCGE